MPALWALAVIMLCSGVAKLRSEEDVRETFTRLRVPRPFDAPVLARAFPWLEVLLAVALVLPFTALRPLVGLAAVALFTAFLLLVVRGRGEGVSCGCFGEASVALISGQTVVRNVVFLVLAVMALAEGVLGLTAHLPAVEFLPLSAFGAVGWVWALVVALLLALAALLVGRESVPAAEESAVGAAMPVPAVPGAPAPAASAATSAPGADPMDVADPADPPRLPFSDAVVISDGQFVGLHTLVATQAVVALRLSVGCGSCAAVIARLPEFQDALGPVLLRVLVPQRTPDAPDAGAIPPELVLGDPDGAAARAVGLTGFPMAVLLGTDRLTAGGPVGGADGVLDFLEEIREIMTVELPAVQVASGAGEAPLADAATPARTAEDVRA